MTFGVGNLFPARAANEVLCLSNKNFCARIFFSDQKSNPARHHGHALKNLMRYLKSTINQRLRYGPGGVYKHLVVYSDADWASDKSDRKSVSGSVVMFYNFEWYCKDFKFLMYIVYNIIIISKCCYCHYRFSIILYKNTNTNSNIIQ